MNKQQNSRGGRGIEWTDYTTNPIKGCFHGCKWIMPAKPGETEPQIGSCYAKDIAERIAVRAYPQGFEHDYWDESELKGPAKITKPSRFFVCSMADLFGYWVSDAHIKRVLTMCAENPRHTFQLLTKNVRRALGWNLPANVWLGASVPPDFMWNKQLTLNQQARMLISTLKALEQSNAVIKWMSIEPLSWDCSGLLDRYGLLDWAVIGAASAGPKKFPPSPQTFRNVVAALDRMGATVFYKGNLRSLPLAKAAWREEFPSAYDAAEKHAV